MMGAHGVADFLILTVSTTQLHAHDRVRALEIALHHLADVVKETRPPRFRRVELQLRGHDGR